MFGLGNKQYEHFNRMGKTTNRELERLGGTRVHAYGEGDDDNALEDDFENWKGPMWESLVRQFHPNKGAGSGGLGSEADAAATEGPVMLSFECVDVSAAEAKKLVASPPRTSQLAASTKHFFTCKSAIVTANRELRSSEAEARAAGLDDSVLAKVGQGSVRHLELRLVDTGLTYTTADNLAVLPENDPAVVAALCKALGYGSQEMTVRPCAEGGRDGDGDGGGEFKYTFPVPFTAQSALSQYFDIHGQPTLGVMKQLLPYVQDDTQKQWLRGFLAKDQREAWKQFLHSTGASVASLLLCELSSCRPPLSDLLHILPFIQPRLYTISSSSSVHPDSVHITVSVTQFELPNGKVFRGLASGFLQNIAVGAGRCRVYVRPSTFRLPTALTTPIVMVGPGTGIAPMRALLQERKFLGAKNGGAYGAVGLKVPPNKNTLYFGCKHSAVDFLYKDELLAFQQEGVLTQLHTAFSRQQAEKVYVQHLVAKEPNDTDLMTDLDAGAFVFVCGDTKMGSDFMDAVVLLLQKKKGELACYTCQLLAMINHPLTSFPLPTQLTYLGMTTEKAQGFVKELQKKGRYVQELWSDE